METGFQHVRLDSLHKVCEFCKDKGVNVPVSSAGLHKAIWSTKGGELIAFACHKRSFTLWLFCMSGAPYHGVQKHFGSRPNALLLLTEKR